MNEFESVHTARVGGNSTITLFLGLFLLVLAFFIVLVSISTREETKSREVMESLTSTFADLAAPVTDPTDFVSKQGEVLSPEDFQQYIAGVFAAAIAVDRVEVVQPGRIMRVDLQARALFGNDSSELRSVQLELMDRVTGALSSSPPGYRYEMAFVIGSVADQDSNLSVEQNQETMRAGSFARTAISRGAPPVSISAGIVPGNPDIVSLYFYARDEESALLQFELPVTDSFSYGDDVEPGEAEQGESSGPESANQGVSTDVLTDTTGAPLKLEPEGQAR